jgi:transcriptional regulator with XRE-family HTH domain
MLLQERINELFQGNPNKKPADLARYVKVSRSSVSSWMSGDTKTISGTNAFAVARFFGVKPEWVQNGNGDKYYSDKEAIALNTENMSALPKETIAFINDIVTLSLAERINNEDIQILQLILNRLT